MYIYTYVRMYVSFFMIKSDVFVSTLKMMDTIKINFQKFAIKIFTIRYENLTKLTNITSLHHTKGH